MPTTTSSNRSICASSWRAFGRSWNELVRQARLRALDERPDGENDRSVDIRVTRLRRKIEPDPDHPTLIRTVRGQGYVYDPKGS